MKAVNRNRKIFGSTNVNPNTNNNTSNPDVSPKATLNTPLSGFGAWANEGFCSSLTGLKSATVIAQGMFDVVQELFSNRGDMFTYKVTVLNDANLSVPSLLIYKQFGDIVRYSILVIETINLPSFGQKINNETVTVDRANTEYCDNTMMTISVNHLTNVLNASSISIEPGNIVLNSVMTLPPQSADDTSGILQAYVDGAVNSINMQDRIDRYKRTAPFTVNDLLNDQVKIVVDTDIKPGSTIRSVTGDIQHNDFNITTSAKPSNVSNTSIHNAVSSVILAKVSGFVDTIYTAGIYTPPTNLMMGQNPPCNIPIAIITDISLIGQPTSSGDSITSFCLGLASLNGLLSGKNIFAVYNRGIGESSDTPSIGSIGLEQPLFNTVSGPLEAFNVTTTVDELNGTCPEGSVSLNEIADNYFIPTRMIAIDSKAGTPLDSMLRILTTNDASSTDLLWNELESLTGGSWNDAEQCYTGGMWSNHWTRGRPFTVLSPIAIPSATYTDVNQQERDYRSLTYLKVVETLAPKGMLKSTMSAYTEGLKPGYCNNLTRHNFKEVIKTLTSTLKCNGVITRYYIDPEFILALDLVMTNCGLRLHTNGLTNIGGAGSNRSMMDNINVTTFGASSFINNNSNGNVGAYAAPTAVFYT